MDWRGYWSVSDVLNHVFCPRITWWWHVLGVPQRGTRKTYHGQVAHDQWASRESGRRYDGQGLRARRKFVGLQLASPELGLQGRLDATVLEDGATVPYDVKNTPAPPQPWPGQVVQVAAYALLLERCLRCPPVGFGIVDYLADGVTRRIPVGPQEKRRVLDLLAEMNAVLRTERMPERAPPSHCRDCVYAKRCV